MIGLLEVCAIIAVPFRRCNGKALFIFPHPAPKACMLLEDEREGDSVTGVLHIFLYFPLKTPEGTILLDAPAQRSPRPESGHPGAALQETARRIPAAGPGGQVHRDSTHQ